MRANGKIDAYRLKLMFVTLGCAAIGGFAATRGLTLEQTIVSSIVVAGLAAAIASKAVTASRALAVIGISVFVIVAAAAVASMWPTVLAATFAASPFLLAAPFVPERRETGLSAAVAALAGASLGTTSAFFVFFAALLCALVWKSVGRRSRTSAQLAPYIAAFTLVGILLNMSILP